MPFIRLFGASKAVKSDTDELFVLGIAFDQGLFKFSTKGFNKTSQAQYHKTFLLHLDFGTVLVRTLFRLLLSFQTSFYSLPSFASIRVCHIT